MKHTKTPWHVAVKAEKYQINNSANNTIATVYRSSDAEFLVRACNAYEKTLEALDLHLAFLDSLPSGWLGKTTGDVGLLNDAYIASNAARKIDFNTLVADISPKEDDHVFAKRPR